MLFKSFQSICLIQYFILLVSCVNAQIEEKAVMSESNSTKKVPDGFVMIASSGNTNNKSLETNKAFLNKDMATNYTNFAQYSGKLLVNASETNGPKIGLQRLMSSAPSQQQQQQQVDSISAVSAPSSSLSVTLLILVSLVVVSCIVALILTALFVMRRRFSIWRLNGARSNDSANCNDGANGVLTNGSESGSISDSSNSKCVAIEVDETGNKKNTDAVDQIDGCLMNSVENKQAMQAIENQTSAEPNSTIEDCAAGTGTEKISQGSPSSVSPLIDTNKDQEMITPTADTNATNVVAAQDAAIVVAAGENKVMDKEKEEGEMDEKVSQPQQSSSSLIVNVLSELSESVASKLIAAKSPSKSALNDPEKEPLNLE